jgi:hypothetical protein
LGFATPRSSLLAAPIALGLSLNAAALAGGFGTDVLGRGFGWRQPVGIIANLAIVVGIVPAVLAVGDGAWNTPATPMTTFLASQLPVDPAAGDYRVLYVGDPRVLPVPGREYAPGISYAVVDSGSLDFTDNFTVPVTAGDDAVEQALQLVADGATLRAGRLLAPHGIRYIVVPETDGVQSTADDPIPIPDGLIAALQNQLDIGSVPGPPAIEVFVNETWIPVGAQLSGPTAEASKLAGADALVRADLSDAVPSMVGADAWPAATNQVAPGVLHLAIPYDPRLHLSVDGTEVASRPSFGVETAFDVDTTGTGVLGYERDPARSWWLAVQLVLWIAVLAVGAGARASFVRRRGPEVHDETLIDLTGAPPLSAGVAGEVLGLPVWDDAPHDAPHDDQELEALDEALQPAGPALGTDELVMPGEPSSSARPSRPAPEPAARPVPARPVSGPAPRPSPARRPVEPEPPEELDLAGLVASVDEERPPPEPLPPPADPTPADSPLRDPEAP